MDEKAAEKQELLKKAKEYNNQIARTFGFKAYNDLNIIKNNESEKEFGIGATCPFCAKTMIFDDPKDMLTYTELENPNNKEMYKITLCPHCSGSRSNKTVIETYNRNLNEIAMKRANEIVDKFFGARLICIKSNMFSSPDEKLLMEKDGEKYYVKYKTILGYSAIGFEDIDDEFRANEGDIVFQYVEEDVYATNKKTGETVPIDSLLLNPERDSTYELLVITDQDNPATSVDFKAKSKTVEVDETKTEEVKSQEDTTETVAEQVTDTTEIEDPQPEIEDPEPETEVPPQTESSSVEKSTEDDENLSENGVWVVEKENKETSVEKEEIKYEIIVDDLNEQAKKEGIFIDDEPKEETDDEIKLSEIEDPEPEIEDPQDDITDNDKDEDNTNSDDEFAVNNDKSNVFVLGDDDDDEIKENDIIEVEIKDDDEPVEKPNNVQKNNDVIVTENDGTIILDLDEGSSLPFSDTSESKKEEISTIISEGSDSSVKNETHTIVEEEDDEEECVLEKIEVFEENDTIILDYKENNKKKKDDTNGIDYNKDTTYGYTSHTDRLRDEAKKVLEKDKKWYDAVVFEQEEDLAPINEFVDEEDLYAEFQDSKLGKVIIEVKTRSNIDARVIINEETCELPFVDFANGVRVICIDCDNVAQMRVPIAFMEKNVKFGYPIPKGYQYRRVYLYSDTLGSKKRVKAAIRNLLKIVNRDNFDPRRVINLAGNYTLFYTDHIPTIRAFEEENSSYPQGKPCTKSIGIIAIRPHSGKNEEFTAKDIMNYLAKNYKANLQSNYLYILATARYIVKPIHERKVVKYQITEYNEISATILKDGFDHIIGAIIKEHQLNNTVKDPKNVGFDFSTYKYEFEFEFDPSCLPSPSLEIWNDEKDWWRIPDSFEDGQGKCYIRSPEYRASPNDGYRNDPRLFLPIPFSKRFKADIEKAGVNVLMDSARRQFIERIGFIEAYYPRIKRFTLNPIAVMRIMFEKSVYGMTKVDLNKFFSGAGIYDGGYDNILMQKMLMNKVNTTDMSDEQKKMMQTLMIQKMMNR